MRECGGCSVCCWELHVPDLNKPPHTRCSYQCEQGCSIHNQDSQPELCKVYHCAWKHDYGEGSDRPDKSGLIVDIIKMDEEQCPFIYAREIMPQALNNGIGMVCDLIVRHNLPAIVSDYGVIPPNDMGNRVVVADYMIGVTKQMRGDLLEDMSTGFSVYELVRKAA